jgi:uncharacterized cupredoxin-like copper-binding protein
MFDVKTRIAVFACAAALFALAAPVAAFAEGSVINVKLQDTSTDPHIPDMLLLLDHSTVAAGPVTIHAANESKRLGHEVLVFHDNGQPLPYNEGAGRLIEKQMESLGEIADLDPGEAREKTFNLTPGTYLLLCNQSNHLKAGMFARLKVVEAGTPITADDKPTAAMMAPPATKAVAVDPSAKDDDDDGS